MRKSVSISVIIVAGFVVGRISHELTARAQEGGPDAERSPLCGDVNVDGVLDLSDPVFVLEHLFLGGPPPECPPSHAELCSPATTGQTVCYDTAGNIVDCNDKTHPGQDAAYQTGRSEADRFVGNTDGTVRDTWTGLVWPRDLAPTRMTWEAALQYCDRLILCEDGAWTTSELEAEEHGGAKYDDWRLPNIKEIGTLARYDTRFPPAMDPAFVHAGDFANANDWGCWSSSTFTSPQADGTSATDRAWVQGFAYGTVVRKFKTQQWRVRAVRGGL